MKPAPCSMPTPARLPIRDASPAGRRPAAQEWEPGQLVPVLLKHSPIRSCQDRAGTDLQATEDCGRVSGGSGTQQQKCNSEAAAVNICCVP